jgi:hypothetical protein
LTFKVIKTIQEDAAGFWRWKALGESFLHLYTTIAELRPRELKLVPVELSGNEDSKSVVKIILSCL